MYKAISACINSFTYSCSGHKGLSLRCMLLLLSKTHSEILFIVYLEQLNTLVSMPHVLLIGISKNKENRAKCHEKRGPKVERKLTLN